MSLFWQIIFNHKPQTDFTPDDWIFMCWIFWKTHCFSSVAAFSSLAFWSGTFRPSSTWHSSSLNAFFRFVWGFVCLFVCGTFRFSHQLHCSGTFLRNGPRDFWPLRGHDLTKQRPLSNCFLHLKLLFLEKSNTSRFLLARQILVTYVSFHTIFVIFLNIWYNQKWNVVWITFALPWLKVVFM